MSVKVKPAGRLVITSTQGASTTTIFPNRHTPANADAVASDSSLTIPAKGARYGFNVEGPNGTAYLQAFLYASDGKLLGTAETRYVVGVARP